MDETSCALRGHIASAIPELGAFAAHSPRWKDLDGSTFSTRSLPGGILSVESSSVRPQSYVNPCAFLQKENRNSLPERYRMLASCRAIYSANGKAKEEMVLIIRKTRCAWTFERGTLFFWRLAHEMSSFVFVATSWALSELTMTELVDLLNLQFYEKQKVFCNWKTIRRRNIRQVFGKIANWTC